jgi:hypothetical protein
VDGFAQIAFYYLKDRATGKPDKFRSSRSWPRELKKVLRQLKKQVMKRFDPFLFSMGVQTYAISATVRYQRDWKSHVDDLYRSLICKYWLLAALTFALSNKKKEMDLRSARTLII